MTIAQLNDITARLIATTEEDIATKTKALRNSVARADLPLNSIASLTAEIAALQVRLATLQEMSILVAG